MREILTALVLIVAIAAGTAFILKAMDWSAAATYKSQNGSVRL